MSRIGIRTMQASREERRRQGAGLYIATWRGDEPTLARGLPRRLGPSLQPGRPLEPQADDATREEDLGWQSLAFSTSRRCCARLSPSSRAFR